MEREEWRAAGVLPDGGDEDEDYSDLWGDEASIDILTWLEAMSEQYHEHTREILGWPWKLFCAKWVRLIRVLAEQRHERDDKKPPAPAY